MRKILSSLALVLSSVAVSLGISSVATSFKGYEYTSLRQATYRITIDGQGTCSGTLIKPHVLLTAAHCDAGALQVEGKRAYILKKDSLKDLMLLYVAPEGPVVSMDLSEPSLDTKVILVGFPFGLGEVVTEGRAQGVAMIPDIEREMAAMQGTLIAEKLLLVTSNGEPGNSGGGLYKKTLFGYKLVGVTSLKADAIIMVIHPDLIKEFLKGV